ncbi:MAG: phosphate ABC transporter permease PstA [Pseudomonadota bacterium]
MTESTEIRASRLSTRRQVSAEDTARRTRRRYRKEGILKSLGIGAIAIAISLLGLLLWTVVAQGYSAFWQTYIKLEINYDAAIIAPNGDRDEAALRSASYASLVNNALYELFPNVEGRTNRRELRNLMSSGAALELRQRVLSDPDLIGTMETIWLLADDDVDQFLKGNISRDVEESQRRISDLEITWIDTLEARGDIEFRFNTILFTNGDSREPELAGIWGAVVGSFYMMVVTFALSVPIGVASALYLEEFASKSRLNDFIEVNINNLAAVPSIVFGLLGLAVFLNVFHLPRSAPIVGGLTLTLMTLPTIVVATRAALRAVPPSIREAALGVGASKVQTIFHHVLPLAIPGILTGAIIGMAQALGETAPLLMIGMIAFIVDIPSSPWSPATALPVQVYLWSDSPERGFTERTAAAIMVLLMFLIAMNALAVFLRRRFERRW